MHIVFISNEYPLWASGGKGTFIQTFARGLVKEGHSVKVLGIGYNRNKVVLEDQGVQLIRLSKPYLPKATYLENFWRIRRELKTIHKTESIDIVETSELDCAYLHQNAFYKKVIRLHGGHHFFATSENRGIDSIKGSREKKSFANADAFIAITEYVKSHTATYLSYHGKPITVIRMPIDLDMFQPIKNQEVKHKLVFAGTVCEKKGIRELLQAFPLVKNRYPNATLDIYGRDWLYPDGRSYIEEMKKNFIQDGVQFHGQIEFKNIPSKYATAHVCIFPSHMETQGLVAPEAMAMGKLVVFSKTGPGKETIDHGNNGFLCDPYNAMDIANQIIKAFETEDEQRIKQQAFDFTRQTFNLDHLLPQNLKFYNSL